MPASDPTPAVLRPMLATSGPVPEGPGWAFEFRWDGLRSIAHVERGRVRVFSAGEREISAGYPELDVLGQQVGRRAVLLDGKIVALDSYGRPSLARLRRRMNRSRPSRHLVDSVPVAYCVFDVLHAEGRSLLRMPFRERRERLEQLGVAGGPVVLPPSFTDTTGRAVADTATVYGLDGVVAKRLDSPYRPGQRTRSWVETTLRQRIEVLVGGWVPSTADSGPAAVLVGLPTERGLSFAGRVRSGLDSAARRELAAALPRLAAQASPFVDELSGAVSRGARWVQPRLVGEVDFRHWTGEGGLANPLWHRLRPDVHPALVRPAVVLGGELAELQPEGARGTRDTTDPADTADPAGTAGTADTVDAAAAELRALREQISPHFVYNALNTVASLVRTDPVRARELLGEFADFTRYAFRTATGLTTIGEELDAVAAYLAVEQARFGARLRTEITVPPDLRAVAVPFLAVQSLVVDSVRNGIEPAPAGGTIRISAELAGGHCVVTVDDDGVARPDLPVRDADERLRGALAGSARMDRRAGDAGTSVTLRLRTG